MKSINTTSQGYKFDKRIFWGMVFILFLILASTFRSTGLNFVPYFECKEHACKNPLLSGQNSCTWALGMKTCDIICDEPWCKDELLPRGEYGKKPSIAHRYFIQILIFLILLCFILNHLIHNKGRKFHVNLMDHFDSEDD